LLVHAPLSRLIYDLNRAPDLPGAMPPRSERPRNSRQQPAQRGGACGPHAARSMRPSTPRLMTELAYADWR
jgi:hypothetical protein